MRKTGKGFTLVELMIVVAIIAILAAVAIPQMGAQIRKSRDSKALGMIGAVRSASSVMMADNGGLGPNEMGDIFAGMPADETVDQIAIGTSIDARTTAEFGYEADGTTAGINVGTGSTGEQTYTTSGSNYRSGDSIHKVALTLNTTQATISIAGGTDTAGKSWASY